MDIFNNCQKQDGQIKYYVIGLLQKSKNNEDIGRKKNKMKP
jgi:hypothetical protein